MWLNTVDISVEMLKYMLLSRIRVILTQDASFGIGQCKVDNLHGKMIS